MANRVPVARSGHVSVVVGKYLLVWGGYTGFEHLAHIPNIDHERYLKTNEVWVYHTDIKQWFRILTEGEYPPGTSGACAVGVEDAVYVVGGHTGDGNSNALYKLSLKDVTWSLIQMESEETTFSPRDKFTAWEHQDKLYIFGGYGVPDNFYLRGNGKYHDDPGTFSQRGWNNQLFYYNMDLEEGKWHNPECKGQLPSPRAAHAVTKVQDKLYLFGGRHADVRLNDLYCLDIPRLIWTQVRVDGELPPGRSWHSFTAMTDTDLFLYGGYTQEQNPLSDAWVVDTTSSKWRKLRVAENKTRLWHTSCRSKDGDVLIFGGCCNNILSPDDINDHTNELLIFRCSPRSLLNISLDAVYDHRERLQSEWETLPRNLDQILKARTEAANPKANSIDQSPSDTIGFTCTVS